MKTSDSGPGILPVLMERVRQACIDAAIQAYEDAGVQGLCEEGRWEAAVAAMRRVDLGRLPGSRPADGRERQGADAT